jgi:hypothetical protein
MRTKAFVPEATYVLDLGWLQTLAVGVHRSVTISLHHLQAPLAAAGLTLNVQMQ